MSNFVYINGHQVDPNSLVRFDEGTEAVIYEVLNHINGSTPQLAKVYHSWAEDYSTKPSPSEPRGVRQVRLIQDKLRNIPAYTNGRLVKPNSYIYNSTGQVIVGFLMDRKDGINLREFSKKSFRKNVDPRYINDILLDLYDIVSLTHSQGIVIGDFSDENVIVCDENGHPHVFLVDFDSMQWGNFNSRLFHWQTIDPLLCERNADGRLNLKHNHNTYTDWYSFAIITMQLWAYVSPYDGIIATAALSKWPSLAAELRPLSRLNIFHPDVNYPSNGIKLSLLPDQLVEYWKQVFLEDKREVFPRQLLKKVVWKECSNCGTIHARKRCPNNH